MKKIILIKYGELTTKKANRNLFINTLVMNIKETLKDFDIKIDKNRVRMFIEPINDNDFEPIINKLKKTFGIHSIVIAYKCDNNIDTIKNNVLEIVKNINFKTFKVETKRSNKKFFKTSISVDVHNPDYTLKIEIRDNNTYIYGAEFKGAGGYPVGVAGKGILMLSGGIDSPVAGYLAMKRGIKLECLYFESPPHTSMMAKNKVKKLVEKLSEYQPDIKLHVINFTNIQENIYKNINPDYMITIMRRMMYRIAEAVMKKRKALVLVNEIIDIAKRIDTYETSILPYEDCCTIFLPKHPVINPKLEKCLEYENTYDYEVLNNEAIDNIETITINKENNKFNF